MKSKYILSVLLAFSAYTFTSCEEEPAVIEELELDRVLAPLGLRAFVRTNTTIELQWTARAGVETYVVEFAEGNNDFSTIIFTDEVTPDELPYRHTFAGETQYSARVKCVGTNGLEDSKWSTTTITTNAEQIFLPTPGDNVQDTYATVLWAAGSEVTHFIINPGNINRPITEGEKAAGEATIEGLSGSTSYTVTLYNGTKRRGTVSFETLTEANVFPEDDLVAVLAAAADGAELILAPGNYVTTGILTLDKSISIVAQKPHLKPVLNVAFNMTGTGAIEFENIELNGTGNNTAFTLATAGIEYGSLTLESCVIHDYGRQLIYGNVASKMASFTVNNSIVYNFVAGGGDFIDFRPTYIANVTLTNSTFYNCPSARDFVRVDAAAGYTATGLTSTVLIDHCTLYGVSNSQDRILYVRFDANVLTVRNTIIAATDGYYSNQPTTTQPTCLNNNYFNAAGFYTEAYVTNAKHDNSGTHRTLDPGFADAANGDFTLSNQTLIDNAVGDPRWRQE